MAEYTYKDVIIDPTSEEAKNCIGKEVYVADNISICLFRANNNAKDFKLTLRSVNAGDDFPFYVGSYRYQIIIPKKVEAEPEYVPFDTIKEFVMASFVHNKDHYLARTGIWIEEPYDDDDTPVCTTMVNSLCVSNNTIFVDGIWLSLKEVLNSYRFLDGTPCGKLKGEEL